MKPRAAFAFVVLMPLCSLSALVGCSPIGTADPAASGASSDAVSGGRSAPDKTSVVLLTIWNKAGVAHYCGSTLIAPDLLLTAAHCVHPDLVGEVDRVTAELDGQDAFSDDRHTMDGVPTYDELFVPPPKSSDCHQLGGASLASTQMGHDIAVIQLKSPISNGRQIATLRSTPLDEVMLGTPANLFGFIDKSAQLTPRREATMTLNRIDQGGISFAITSDGGKLCSGDSGGGVFATIGGVEYLIGVIAAKIGAAVPCGTPGEVCGSVGAYATRVDTDLAFIGRWLPAVLPTPAPVTDPTPPTSDGTTANP